MSLVLQEHMSVHGDDTGLVRLCDIGKNDINHSDEHAVFVGVTGVFDDGDDVGAFFGDVDEVTAGTVREFDGVDQAGLWIPFCQPNDCESLGMRAIRRLTGPTTSAT